MVDGLGVVFATGDDESRTAVPAGIETQEPTWDVTATATIEETIDVCDNHPIDCIVTTDSLAVGSGLDLMDALREQSDTRPSILFTHQYSPDHIQSAFDIEVAAVLPYGTSPAAISTLCTQITRTINHHREIAQAARLERINTVIRELNQELVRASNPAEIDQRVCELISNAEPYLFAWIGEHDPETKTVVPRCGAGVEEGYLDSITITTDDTETAQGPTGQAIKTHALQVMQNIPADPDYKPWREAALERGYRSSAAIPLVYDDTLYGVLNVYSNRVYAFDADERALLNELAETIAYAYHDLEVQQERRRLQRAVEQAADAIFMTDTAGTIEFVNPAFETLTEYSATAAIGASPSLLKSGEMDDEYYSTMWETILAGEIWESEIINQRASGERYVAEQTIAPITDANDDIERFVAIQRDITERKDYETALKESRERLRVLFDHAPDGIVVHDVAGNILDVNETLASRLGYTKDELQTMAVTDFEVGIEPDLLFDQWETLETEAIQKLEVDGLHRCKDGTEYPVEVWVSKVTAPETEQTQFIGIARDVTDRHERQRALERHKIFLELSTAMLTGIDGSGTVSYQSPSVDRLLGYGPADLVGESYVDLIHPDDRDTVFEAISTVTTDPFSEQTVEYRIRDYSGEWRWMRSVVVNFLDEPEIENVILTSTDITDRKEQEAALRERDRQYRAVIENSHDGLIITQHGTIQFVNDRMAQITGYSRTKLRAKSFTELVEPAEVPRVRTWYQDRLRGAQMSDPFEIELISASGEPVPVELSVGVFEYNGNPATITAVRDITERVDRTRQLQVLDRVLRHNLRNDMTIMMGYAETICAEYTAAAEDAEQIIARGKRLMETVNKEREIVDIIATRPQRSTTDVTAVCTDVVEEIEHEFPHATITFSSPPMLTARTTTKLGRALEELLGNAITHSDQAAPTVSVSITREDDMVAIEIADDGPGIPAEEVNVLTRKYEIEPLYHGSGLGLWLVNWIIRRSQGTLHFSENEPRGSVVTIQLPAATA